MIFSFLGSFFHEFLYRPLFNFLFFVYNLLPNHDLGMAVFVITLAVRILVFPVNLQAYNFQQAMAKVQGRLKDIQEKYKSQPAEQSRLMSELFRQEKINPLSSFVPLLVQLPVMLALYQIFWRGLWSTDQSLFYGFVSSPERVNSFFLGLFDLSKPHVLLAAGAGLAQFVQTWFLSRTNPALGREKNMFSSVLQKEMLFIFPFMTFFILLRLPSVLGFYWGLTSLLSLLEQRIFKKLKSKQGSI